MTDTIAKWKATRCCMFPDGSVKYQLQWRVIQVLDPTMCSWEIERTSQNWPTDFQITVNYWCWSWNSSTLATSWEKLTHWKRLWCWEGLGARGEGDNRGWDGWIASLTRWTWVWVNSGSWWWTGRPGVLRFMGLQRVGHDWATKHST